jgi:lysine-N-methylase
MNTKRCPFLTEENLCQIQRELGEEYLSYTCSVYPREFIVNKDFVSRTCSASCYAVMETLCSDESCMNLVKTEIKLKTEEEKATKKVKMPGYVDKDEDIEKYPKLKYRPQLFEFFYELLSDKRISLESAIIMGALCAQKPLGA